MVSTVGEVILMLTTGMIMVIVGVIGVLITSIVILTSLISQIREKRGTSISRNIDYSSLNIDRSKNPPKE